MEHLIEKHKGKISSAFWDCRGIIEAECDCGIEEEHREWIKFAKDGSEIAAEMWNEEKAKWLKKGITLY